MANKYKEFSRLGKPDEDPEKTERKKENDAAFYAAERDTSLPDLDLHGMEEGDVPDEVDMFFQSHPDQRLLRITSGHGTGVIKQVLRKYLREFSRHPDCPFEDFRENPTGASFTVLMKKE